MIAVNKPARMDSVPGPHTPLPASALGMVQKRFAESQIKPYPLHRLDRDTSGILLFGKHERERATLEGIPRANETRKRYWVMVKGTPSGKVITKKIPSRVSGEDIFAQTNYKVIRTFPEGLFSLVEAEIITGRRHQIRRHFAAIGHPVVLDGTHGDPKFNKRFRTRLRLGRQFLHARFMEFVHPITKAAVRIEAPMPMDLQSVLKRLGTPMK